MKCLPIDTESLSIQLTTTKGVPRRNLDPWMMQLPCRRGVIYPYGCDRLAVDVDYRPITAANLADFEGVSVVQDGDHEKTFVFPVAMFEQVAHVVLPRKRRVLSDKQRAECAARLAMVRQK